MNRKPIIFLATLIFIFNVLTANIKKVYIALEEIEFIEIHSIEDIDSNKVIVWK